MDLHAGKISRPFEESLLLPQKDRVLFPVGTEGGEEPDDPSNIVLQQPLETLAGVFAEGEADVAPPQVLPDVLTALSPLLVSSQTSATGLLRCFRKASPSSEHLSLASSVLKRGIGGYTCCLIPLVDAN